MSQTEDQPTILVVEDNPDDIVLLELAAEEACPGVAFVFKTDGLAALAYLNGEGRPSRKRPVPRAVVVDARLPNIDGFTMVQRIRQVPGMERARILLWTDGREPDFAEQARQAGADEAMFKRASFHELLEVVGRICELARTATSTRA